MGLLNQIKDNFTRAEFKVLPDKQLKTISAEFEKALKKAEKLTRKKESGISGEQLKKVEEELAKLVDAMNNYRKGNQ